MSCPTRCYRGVCCISPEDRYNAHGLCDETKNRLKRLTTFDTICICFSSLVCVGFIALIVSSIIKANESALPPLPHPTQDPRGTTLFPRPTLTQGLLEHRVCPSNETLKVTFNNHAFQNSQTNSNASVFVWTQVAKENGLISKGCTPKKLFHPSSVI